MRPSENEMKSRVHVAEVKPSDLSLSFLFLNVLQDVRDDFIGALPKTDLGLGRGRNAGDKRAWRAVPNVANLRDFPM
jgi:hypothetical protein